MADTKYTVIPVSDPDEKVDPNAPPEEPEQHECQNRRRGWCRRWRERRALREGQDDPQRNRWRIVRRIFLAFILIHLAKHAFRGRFEWHDRGFRFDDSMAIGGDDIYALYDPTFEDPKFYGTDLADQDPIAQELLQEFSYVFHSQEDLLDIGSYNSLDDRWTDLRSENDPLDFPEDEPREDEPREDEPRDDPLDFPEDEPREDEPEVSEPEEGEPEEGEPEEGEPEEGEPEEGEPKDPDHPRHPHPPHRRPGPPGPPHRRPPHRRPPHRRPHHPHCNKTNLVPWDGPSGVTFSPYEFKSFAILLNGANPPPAIVKIRQLEESDATEHITVNYTILVGDEKLNNVVSTSAYDYEGTFVVEINTPKQRPHGPPSSKNCIKISIDVTFPAGLDTYGNFSLRLSHAIVKAHNLGDIKFENFNAGVGRGALLFRHVSASNVRIGAARGFIRGWFDVANNATFGTIKGASHVRVNPVGDVLRLKAAVVSGAVAVNIPADVYEGRFVLASLFGHPTITAPEPGDVHVEKFRPNFKAGYYKTKTDSIAILSAKHGKVDLTFNVRPKQAKDL
ncbi:hypothetical protein BC937DRAFT_88317, partial [Endogone sp. FLAS-F59071]